jgi:hypothetical protein
VRSVKVLRHQGGDREIPTAHARVRVRVRGRLETLPLMRSLVCALMITLAVLAAV